jgi:hypothetical protein
MGDDDPSIGDASADSTTGGGMTLDGPGTADDTAGPASGSDSNPGDDTTMDGGPGPGSDTGDSGGSDTGGGGPGVIPNEFPGVDVGLCAPPGEVQYCYTGAPRTYLVGECGPGTQQCVALDLDFGEWSDCEDETLPSLEICDGLDNDCDGEVDEEQGFTQCGMGPCLHEVPNCLDGIEQECDPFDGATPEVCDLLDNDCDGDIDEGLGDDTTTCGVGECEHSVTGCENGMPLDCDPFEGATPEVCDNLDNDCDGATDEGLPDITCGCGVCEHTIPSCINGFPQTCDPFEGASPEICDGLDNDCDCDIDEGQGVWTCGQDACEVTVPQCIDGVAQPPSTCQPIPGGTEICGDGEDNNCDGVAPPCAESFLVGTDTTVRPIDIIWAIDSSGSMGDEMQAVEDEINTFADTLAASGSSVNLHLIADRGTDGFEICVDPPLGGGGCADNVANGFWQYDTNGSSTVNYVHSSNALGRIMQQSPVWIDRLQANSHVAFIVTTDDDGDDPLWTAADGDACDGLGCDDPTSTSFIANGTSSNLVRWDAPGDPNYTSLAYDHQGLAGFATFVETFFPGYAPDTDWSFYSIVGRTGTTVLTGADDVYEFNTCASTVEPGQEYVKLSLLTNRQSSMFSTCTPSPWPLDSLADDIVSGVPNDLYDLSGSPPGTCGQINPATITVVVNGIPLAPADWNYDAMTCVLQITNNVPVVGDNVVIVYDNF